MKKLLTICLVLLMLGSVLIISSCSDDNSSNVIETTTTAQNDVETEVSDTKIPSSLPQGLDFGGTEITVWYFTVNSDASERFLDLKGELTGDIIDEVLYERNLAVEEQLNIKINYYDQGVASSNVGGEIRKVIMSDTTDYDVYSVIQWNSAILAVENLFLNVYGNKYLDLDKPWWAGDYMQELSIGHDRLYFLCGDISLDMIRCISSIYFNKQIYENVFGDSNDMYNTVLENKWTMDKLIELTAASYSDLNGDGEVNEGDRLGYYINQYNNIDPFVYGSGVRVTTRNEDNIPEITMNNERTVAFAEKLEKLCYGTIGVICTNRDNFLNVQEFINGNSLFLHGFLYTSENLREMENDYGIIPFPMFNETQESYKAVVHDIATLMCLPQNCQIVDEVCAMLEAMAYYSYYNVTPAYYETALKTKYARDEISSQIIDIIHDHNMTDIAYVYGGSFNNLGYIFRNMVGAKDFNFTSRYSSSESAAITNMNKLIDQYMELD